MHLPVVEGISKILSIQEKRKLMNVGRRQILLVRIEGDAGGCKQTNDIQSGYCDDLHDKIREKTIVIENVAKVYQMNAFDPSEGEG